MTTPSMREALSDEQIDQVILAGSYRNAAGGIYASATYKFARDIAALASQAVEAEPADPLRDDGAALRLAVRLNLTLRFYAGNACVQAITPGGPSAYENATCLVDPVAAARQAIVQAAGKMEGSVEAEPLDLSEQLTRAKNLLIRLHSKHPEARAQIEQSTGSWFAWGVDRDAPVEAKTAEPSDVQSEAKNARAELDAIDRMLSNSGMSDDYPTDHIYGTIILCEQASDAAPSTGQAETAKPSDADKYEACKLQAQQWKQEATTANATIAEIYQLCTGKTGEPGNWNGAKPVREMIERLTAPSTGEATPAQVEPGLIQQMLQALKGAVRVADRKTMEFDAVHEAITRAETALATQPTPEAAQVKPRPAQSPWKTIETAPFSGKPVLIYEPGERGGMFKAHRVKHMNRKAGWITHGALHDLSPTHWMPLPLPPAE